MTSVIPAINTPCASAIGQPGLKMDPIWYRYFNQRQTDEDDQFSSLDSRVTTLEGHFPLPFLSVKDFGAKGDGVTDDTAAIQATINQGATNKGALIYFPVGVYNHTGISVPNAADGITLAGMASPPFATATGHASKLVYTNTTGDWIKVNVCVRCTIENLELTATNICTADNAINMFNNLVTAWHRIHHVQIDNCFNGILIDSCSFCEVDRVDITPANTASYGLKWRGAVNENVLFLSRINVRPSSLSTTVVGFFIGQNVNTLNAAQSGTGNCNVGWQFDQESGNPPALIVMSDCVAEGSNSHGIRFNHVTSVDMTNHYCNINSGLGIRIGASAFNIRIANGQTNQNGSHGI